MYRLLDDDIVPDLDESAVGNERGVERGEGVLLELCHRSHIALDERAVRIYGICNTEDSNASAELTGRRQFRAEHAIDEDDRVPALFAEREAREIGFLDADGIRCVAATPSGLASISRCLRGPRKTEWALDDRGDTRKMPVFVFRGRKTERLEARHSVAAKFLQPLGSLGLAGEVLTVRLD